MNDVSTQLLERAPAVQPDDRPGFPRRVAWPPAEEVVFVHERPGVEWLAGDRVDDPAAASVAGWYGAPEPPLD
jgi:hypothetical protein